LSFDGCAFVVIQIIANWLNSTFYIGVTLYKTFGMGAKELTAKKGEKHLCKKQ